jgi:hypothetical protein
MQNFNFLYDFLRVLSPNSSEKKACLIKSICEILWNAGGKQFASVVTKVHKNLFHIPDHPNTYYPDGFTEKVSFDFNFNQSVPKSPYFTVC